jgi:hypothetical protein
MGLGHEIFVSEITPDGELPLRTQVGRQKHVRVDRGRKDVDKTWSMTAARPLK